MFDFIRYVIVFFIIAFIIYCIIDELYGRSLKSYLIENGIVIFPFIKKYLWNKKVIDIYEYPNGLVANIVDKDKIFFTFNGKLITNIGDYKVYNIKENYFAIICKTIKPRMEFIDDPNDFSFGSNFECDYRYVDDQMYVYFIYNSAGKIIKKKSVIFAEDLVF